MVDDPVSENSSQRQLFGDYSDEDDDSTRKEMSQTDSHNNIIIKDEQECEKQSHVNHDEEDEYVNLAHAGISKWDFDEMMERRKKERSKRKKKHGDYDLINDNDNRIIAMVAAMNQATEEDRIANRQQKPAVKKIKLLPEVKLLLLRTDMVDAMIDNGMMNSVSDWLSPLPDKSLPSLEVRSDLLKLLQDFDGLDQNVLRQSGLGRAVMMLFKHPKELKANKELAAKLIRAWSRPIFQLDTDLRSVSREERVYRDRIRMPEVKRRRLSEEHRDVPQMDPIPQKSEDSFIPRARVPKPSTKDYVMRPKHLVEGPFRGERRERGVDRLKKVHREFQDRTKTTKFKSGVPLSVDGRNLAI